MGANDYVTKPFGSNEFLARIRSTLRMTTHRMQNGMFPGGKFKASGLTIDYDARRVFLHKRSEADTDRVQYHCSIVGTCGKGYDILSHYQRDLGYNDEGSIKNCRSIW